MGDSTIFFTRGIAQWGGGGLLPHFFVIKIGDDVDVLDT